jgi:ABC-type sulfate/molybdate transport systems ATPase subunit
MIDVSDRIFWLRDGKIERIETRAEVAVKEVE